LDPPYSGGRYSAVDQAHKCKVTSEQKKVVDKEGGKDKEANFPDPSSRK
jgi:hypothetical protein